MAGDIQDFARALLADLGVSDPSPVQIQMILSWADREGTSATNNPLATTQAAPGSYYLPGNTAGVQQYPTLAEGAKATADTIRNGNYPNILRALISGDTGTFINGAQRDFATWSGGGYTGIDVGGGGQGEIPGQDSTFTPPSSSMVEVPGQNAQPNALLGNVVNPYIWSITTPFGPVNTDLSGPVRVLWVIAGIISIIIGIVVLNSKDVGDVAKTVATVAK